jgi:membrane protein DedA with SNARE-associated domain
METGVDWISQYGYAAIFALLMLGIVGLPVPDEILLTFVGYLSFKGDLHLAPALITAFLGSACGISFSYGLGRLVGLRMATRLGSMSHLQPEHLAEAQRWVRNWGKYALVVGYFIPGVRHLVGIIAGASMLPIGVFARFAYAGALLWSGSFVALGYEMGEQWSVVSAFLHRTLVPAAILVVLALGSILFVAYRRRSR